MHVCSTKRCYVPAQPLLGSEVLLAYLETKQGSRLLPYIPPSWAGLHRGRDTQLDGAEVDATPISTRRGVVADSVETKAKTKAREEAQVDAGRRLRLWRKRR